MKNNKWSQKGLKIDDVALNGAFWTQKNYGVQISSRKWNPFVTDEFPYETLILRKRLSVLYTKCIQFLMQASLLSCTCYVGEMMTPCQLSTFSEFICSAFQFQGLIARKISKCMKNNKWSQKGLQNWWCGFEWCILNTEKLWSSNKFKKWNPFVTDEFPYETLILRKRLSVLYTKCIQFLP